MAKLEPFEVVMRVDFAASDGSEICAHVAKVRELIRCRDCKHYEGLAVCRLLVLCGGSDFYCEWGERRGNECD